MEDEKEILTNKDYFNLENDDVRLELFLYFSKSNFSSRKKIKAFLGSEINLDTIALVKLYSEID